MVDDPGALEPRQARTPPRTAMRRHCVTGLSENHGKNADFILSGFHQEDGIRCYKFECSNGRGAATEFTVDADVRLLQKYGIVLQELPLLCRHLLEEKNAGSLATAVTFTEDLMKEQADWRLALKQASQAKKKAYRRRRPTRLGHDLH